MGNRTRIFDHPAWKSLTDERGGVAAVLAHPDLLLDLLASMVVAHDRIVDGLAALPRLGLTTGQAIDLLEPAILDERAAVEAWTRFPEGLEGGVDRTGTPWCRTEPFAQTCRAAVRILNIRDLEPDEIDRLLFDYRPYPVAGPYLERHPVHPKARDVFHAHRDGWTISRIQADLGIPDSTVEDILDQIGETPNRGERARQQESARSRHKTVVRLREKEGLTNREIADKLQITENQVRKHFVREAQIRARAARRRGAAQ
jgi:DNA-binding CsgD family transcriptional regulator